MARTRYAEAARLGEGRRVLEVACGPGRGLGLIARRARFTVGGDYTFSMVRTAARHYRGRVSVLQFDAQALPFCAGSFDLIVMFEAIYYVPDAERFFRESRRVLAPEGQLVLCSANREWPGFTSSAFATRFLSAAELAEAMSRHGFDVRMLGAFEALSSGVRSALVSWLRRTALRLGLVPRTLVGRQWLKRVFYGRLVPLGPEILEDGPALEALKPIVDPTRPVENYKVIYAVGRLA